jgi:hypothetical protein
MATRGYQYRLTLEQLTQSNGEPGAHAPMQLEFMNHDEIFSIIERLQQKDPFGDTQQATEFAIGLKLFSEVMLRNRNHPLFTELGPAFRDMMQKLKQG